MTAPDGAETCGQEWLDIDGETHLCVKPSTHRDGFHQDSVGTTWTQRWFRVETERPPPPLPRDVCMTYEGYIEMCDRHIAVREERDRLSAGLRKMARKVTDWRRYSVARDKLYDEQNVMILNIRDELAAVGFDDAMQVDDAVAAAVKELDELREQQSAERQVDPDTAGRALLDVSWTIRSTTPVHRATSWDDLTEDGKYLFRAWAEQITRAQLAAQRPEADATPDGVCWCRFGDTCEVCGQTPVGAVRLHLLQVSGQIQTRKERWDGTRWIPDSMFRNVDDAFIPCPDEPASVSDRRPVPAHPTTWTHPRDEQCVHCASVDRLASADPVIDCPRSECPFDSVLTSRKPGEDFDIAPDDCGDDACDDCRATGQDDQRGGSEA